METPICLFGWWGIFVFVNNGKRRSIMKMVENHSAFSVRMAGRAFTRGICSLLIALTAVFNITQASAGCNIVWNGGSMPTNEKSRTLPAAEELYNAIHNRTCFPNGEPMGFTNNDCYGVSGSGYRSLFYKWVCTDGTWELGTEYYCGPVYETCYCGDSGGWDVVCDTSTTTTQQTTTTTTAPATLINLSSITATPEFNKVIIQWSTGSEIDNAGFNLYRAESEVSQYKKINTSLIPAQDSSTQSASYEFVDTNVKNRKTYYYKLEDIDLNGMSTFHGPVTATPRLLFRFFK